MKKLVEEYSRVTWYTKLNYKTNLSTLALNEADDTPSAKFPILDSRQFVCYKEDEVIDNLTKLPTLNPKLNKEQDIDSDEEEVSNSVAYYHNSIEYMLRLVLGE